MHLSRIYSTILLVLFLAVLRPAIAQSPVIQGIVQDEITGKGVLNALVLNYSKRLNVYSDNNGVFTLDVSLGDTVVLSAVGYYFQKFVVNDSLLGASFPVKFTFTPRAYELTEARIIGLGSYSDFKNSFTSLQRPKTKLELLADNLAEISKNAGKEAYDMAIASGRIGMPGAGIPIRSPEEKERTALKKIMEKDQIREQIYMKFNPEIIKKITGLTDEGIILEFMTYCDFSDEYLLEVNEYDLSEQIGLKFEDYKCKRGLL